MKLNSGKGSFTLFQQEGGRIQLVGWGGLGFNEVPGLFNEMQFIL
jgi:hypothetical protein